MQYQKVKSVAKHVEVKGERLATKVLATMKKCSDLVGATLGPGGCPVIIERQEENMPPMITKDGVTVFRSIGFDDSVEQILMEAARDASVRTANEAGDGTTTATILAEAIVRRTHDFCKRYPRVSPQKVVRRLQEVFKDQIEPSIRDLSVNPNDDKHPAKLLHAVARISANGDTDLADAVMECNRLVGDAGNVTILEISGPSSYEVERIEGYPIGIGYDDSCARYWPMFINDQGTQRCLMDNVGFILYHGKLTDIQTAILFLEKIGKVWDDVAQGHLPPEEGRHNIVLVATGFSDGVLATLGNNFVAPSSINVFPLLAPPSPIHNGQLAFLEDLAAITGAIIFDPITKPLDTGEMADLGPGVRSFEAGRFRSTVIGHAAEDLILDRVSKLEQQVHQSDSSILEVTFLNERIGKLTGGIAKLKVIGASNGELREKRDRAEDAVCAVRGAIKHGVLPGGGWTLCKLFYELGKLKDEIVNDVLRPALLEPVDRLFHNVGLNIEETAAITEQIADGIRQGQSLVYDCLEHQMVDAFEGGVLDSTPAVLEAIRNSISIASLLGTLGGAVVFKRDLDLERTEARDTADFLRNANYNPADEKG